MTKHKSMLIICLLSAIACYGGERRIDRDKQPAQTRITAANTKTPDSTISAVSKPPLAMLDKKNSEPHPIQPIENNWSALQPLKQTTNIDFQTKGTKLPQVFPERYTEIEGVLTFRGNNLRDAPAYGARTIVHKRIEKVWSFRTSSSSWGGGAGWTGQPAIVRWEAAIQKVMNLKEEFALKKGFVETIYASLDGNVYFFDLDSGKESRDPIRIGNPIKGSVSVDARGYPLLYVGEGIPEKKRIGFGLYSLIDGTRLYYEPGIEEFAYRKWGAFDSSALFNREADTLVVGGENGLFYQLKLNTSFDAGSSSIAIKPQAVKYKYIINGKKGNPYNGIENSVAVYKNLVYFSDNMGAVQCVDLLAMEPVWALPHTDDTDASLVLDIEEDKPYLYTGTEVDKQGSKGNAIIRKIDGLTGKSVWQLKYPALTIKGDHPVNGGILATPIKGKGEISDWMIFTIARYKSLNAGLMVAIDKATGKEVWRWEMPNYAWSSPVDVYDKSGKSYIIQADSAGNIHLLDGKTGKVLHTIRLGSNIEASPAVYNDKIVVAARGGIIYCLKIV
ncbi:PQQ-binding-like beta-propeller repeat protein [Paenibacillus solisilvae]|uniref:PQQ-binding-like beta-propeller repeat protein n=1 Tax=Paenibacillus solisilvae TaxID=2486751 RepID=A0ABW0VVN6_9BACL